MARFTKKAVTIEAVQFTSAPEAPMFEMPDWLHTALSVDPGTPGAVELVKGMTPPTLMIHTLEGPMRVHVGDWIIRGVAGEIYPCKPEIFARTYDPAG